MMIMKKSFYIFIFVSSYLFSQISPGELSSSHSKLEGLTNCTKCHTLGEKISNLKCLDCHKEIQKLISSNLGYHSSIDIKNKFCWSCHSDHNGRNFQIIKFDSKTFNHSKTKFTLNGKHISIECNECHQNKFIKDSQLKKRKKTFLGLETNCSSCHDDVHQNTLGDKCNNCHNEEKFKPAVLFEHNKTKFILTGKHLNVDCNKCHEKAQRNGKDFQKFKGLNYENCTPCHKDIHQGKFDKNCQKCHSAKSFNDVNTSLFEHSKTNFKLIGLHQKVDCKECHKINFKVKLNYSRCLDCHKDYHNGEFTFNNLTKDCQACHNEFGYSPSLFAIENHNKIKYKLAGSHLSVPCISCHYKNKIWSFKKIGDRCIDCHSNIHKNEISEKFLEKNNCEGCHIVDNWKLIKFDHNKTRFVLKGKHFNISCRDCHYRLFNSLNKEYKFSSLKSNCEECHRDIHYSQFKVGEISNCENCHSFNNWLPNKFDHNQTRFALTGAHQKIDCSRCHKLIIDGEKKYIKYRLDDFKCSSCHL